MLFDAPAVTQDKKKKRKELTKQGINMELLCSVNIKSKKVRFVI